MPDTPIAAFAAWLKERCEFLQNLEREAERLLQADHNTEKYKAMMCQKAMFIQALPEEAEKHLDGLPPEVADMALGRLERFSRSASRALDINSAFYMYALLYPEEHQKGQPNDLEVFTAEIAALAGK